MDAWAPFFYPEPRKGICALSDRSRIEWTDATWKPVTGCFKVSPGVPTVTRKLSASVSVGLASPGRSDRYARLFGEPVEERQGLGISARRGRRAVRPGVRYSRAAWQRAGYLAWSLNVADVELPK